MNRISRRSFMKQLAAATSATAAFRAGARAKEAPSRQGSGGRQILLSARGGDRATGYAMSGKIVGRDGHYLCTWLDCTRQNQWALVDAESGAIVQRGTVGPPLKDNHCGAAVCLAPDGTAHLVVGAHHGSFMHYRMLPGATAAWQLAEDNIGRGATYPSVVCDAEGTLHLTYRCRELEPGRPYPYHLMYARRRKQDARWSEPRPLARVAVLEHTWLTNTIEAGPDGRLHVVLSNTRKLADGSYYYGGSHLCSGDGGRSWRQLGDDASLRLPGDVGALKLIEGPAPKADRTQSREAWERQRGRGPGQYYYNEILLSNPTVDETGRPWVILHNLLKGEAHLCRAEKGIWIATPLAGAVNAVLPEYRITHAGQLSRHRDGTLEAVVTAAPAGAREWGAKGTKLVRVLVAPEGVVRHSELVAEPRANGVPDWLPSIQRWCGHAPMNRPALLYMRGLNSGENVNDVETEVWLQMPPG